MKDFFCLNYKMTPLQKCLLKGVLLFQVTQTKSEVDEAKALALMAHDETQAAKIASEAAKAVLEQIEEEIKEVLDTQGASPDEIRQVADDVSCQLFFVFHLY